MEPNHSPSLTPAASRSTLIQIAPLPQHVPSRVCVTCEVCCRFPEADSFLRPYFTADEIASALSAGIDPAAFPDLHGSQIRVIPHPTGEGYVCAAFDAATSHCRIYEKRPLDCQIYPLAVMWSEDGSEVVLGWDRKCPFLETGRAVGTRGNPGSEYESIEEFGARIAGLIQQDTGLEIYAEHPRLIGPYQDDVVVLQRLPRLSARIREKDRSSPASPPSRQSHLESRLDARPSTVASQALRPLTGEDYPRFDKALRAVDTTLAAYALAPHLMWRHLFSYRWMEDEDHLCLFAQYADGLFMPLPPLRIGSSHTSLSTPLAHAFAVMQKHNGGSAVSRVENVPEEGITEWEAWGYRLTPKDPDYVYEGHALVQLRGDRYKSQRAACNRFMRAHRFRYEPYGAWMRGRCLDLYRRWALQKEARGVEAASRMMMEDAATAHDHVLGDGGALDLIGRVLWADDILVAYTFGYFRTPSLFCVLLEIADRSIPGAGSFIFREFCREACELGATFINTMDDSGLGTLKQAKQAYHPSRTVKSYIATPMHG